MAVTTDEILARGNGPVQTTWADQTLPTPSPTPPQQPVADNEPTGVENVIYDTVSNQGAPDNPKNAREVVERGVVNVANPTKPQTTTDEEHVTPVDDRQKGNQDTVVPKLSYTEMFEKMSPYKPPTPEELEKERKRQKREAIFAAIGEGISAMSNLYFTTQYAPNAFDPTSGMAATTKARFDKLKKDREDNQREYMEGYLRAMKMDADAAAKERTWTHTLEREKVTDHWRELLESKKQAKEEFDAQKRQLEIQRLQGKITMEEYLTEQERLETEFMKANNMKMPVKPKPSTGGSRGGGGGKKTSVWKAHNPTTGEEITIYATDRANAWSQCPQGYEIRQEPTTTTSTRTQQNRHGQTTKSTTTTTTKNQGGKTGGVSSGKKPNPMGGSGNGGKQKKKNPMS